MYCPENTQQTGEKQFNTPPPPPIKKNQITPNFCECLARDCHVKPGFALQLTALDASPTAGGETLTSIQTAC